MISTRAPLDDAHLVVPESKDGGRGFFACVLHEGEMAAMDLVTQVVQGTNSYSGQKETLRCMHCELAPNCGTKLVGCIRAGICDFMINMRSGSTSLEKRSNVERPPDHRTTMYIPRGFTHGFLTISDEYERLYLEDAFFASGSGPVLRWNDPAFSIAWLGAQILMSEKAPSAPYPDREWHLPGDDA
jgi:dTDP-4-dehydrorhamnose 3,5-epimerase